MEKEVVCKMCGKHFIGFHNAMYCESCREERARQASTRTWQKARIQKESETRKARGQKINNFEISMIDTILAKEKEMSIGSFELWKLCNGKEYLALVKERGYQSINGELYKTAKKKDVLDEL